MQTHVTATEPPAPPGRVPASPLILVTGRPGSGKSTLSRRIAAALGCPLLARDEVFEGIRLALRPSDRPADNDTVSARAFEAFFSAIRLMTSSGVVCVAEAAFQHDKWLNGLATLGTGVAFLHVHCHLNAAVACSRVNERQSRAFAANATHPALAPLAVAPKYATNKPHTPLSLPCPTITVDTADGYAPSFDQILAFIVSNIRKSDNIQ